MFIFFVFCVVFGVGELCCEKAWRVEELNQISQARPETVNSEFIFKGVELSSNRHNGFRIFEKL